MTYRPRRAGEGSPDKPARSRRWGGPGDAGPVPEQGPELPQETSAADYSPGHGSSSHGGAIDRLSRRPERAVHSAEDTGRIPAVGAPIRRPRADAPASGQPDEPTQPVGRGTSNSDETSTEMTMTNMAAVDDEIDAADRKNLGRNSLLMASGTLVSRVLGMVNAMLLAKVVGQALAADAFRLANTLPNYILVLLSGGILNAVLLPQITKAMKRPDGGKDFVDRLLTATLTLILVVAVLCTAGAGVLMRVLYQLEGAGLHLGIAFAYICMPQVLFYALFAVLGNLLNARGSFGAFGWAPVVNNVVAIGGEIVFLSLWGQQADPSVWSSQMVWTLAGSATLGIIAQTLVLLPVLKKIGFRYTPRFGLRGYGFGQVGRFAALTFIALCIAQAGGLYIANVASGMMYRAPQGTTVAGYAAYQNAMTLFQMPYSLIGFSILTALFPQLARAWQRRASAGLGDARDLVYRGLTLPAVGIIPVAFLLMALARPIVRGIYWGISPAQASVTAPLLMLMAAALLPFTIVTFQQQFCFALERGFTNLWMQCLVTAVQVGFGFAAQRLDPAHGVEIICLGMIAGNSVLAIVFVLYARREMEGIGLARMIWLYLRLAVASLLGATPAYLVGRVVVASQADSLISQFGAMALGAVVFIIGFLIGVKLLAIDEFRAFLRPILRRLHLVRSAE